MSGTISLWAHFLIVLFEIIYKIWQIFKSFLGVLINGAVASSSEVRSKSASEIIDSKQLKIPKTIAFVIDDSDYFKRNMNSIRKLCTKYQVERADLVGKNTDTENELYKWIINNKKSRFGGKNDLENCYDLVVILGQFPCLYHHLNGFSFYYSEIFHSPILNKEFKECDLLELFHRNWKSVKNYGK